MAAPGWRPLGLVPRRVLVREAEHAPVAEGIPHQRGRLGPGTGRQLTAALPLGIHCGGGIAGLTPVPSAPETCTRSSAPGCLSAPSPRGSPPAPTTSGWQQSATRHPGLPAGLPAPPPPGPGPPGAEQLRDLASQGYGPRKIARITGCSERAIRQLLTSGGLRQPALLPDRGIDPHWLREHYRDRQRSLKDIAAETGTTVEALADAARKAGIRVRHGINGRAHPLAALGGPGSFPADVWNVFTHPGSEQRIRRLLALPGQPSIQHAARQLGIRTAVLTGQVRQLEAVVGTALLLTGPDGRLALTAYGERFARDVTPVLNMLA
jgi:hypothetical protein